MWCDDWSLAVSNRRLTDVIYFDFSKAFDSVSHPKLLYKLSAYGLIGTLLEIMTAFLSNRLQRVAIDNVCSPYAPVTTWLDAEQSSRPVAVFTVYYPRESSRERLCNHRRWFVCLLPR